MPLTEFKNTFIEQCHIYVCVHMYACICECASRHVCVLSHSAIPDSLRTSWAVACLGSSVYGIFQARILEWVTISSSKGSPPPRD